MSDSDDSSDFFDQSKHRRPPPPVAETKEGSASPSNPNVDKPMDLDGSEEEEEPQPPPKKGRGRPKKSSASLTPKKKAGKAVPKPAIAASSMAISISSSDDDEWVLEKVQTEESKVTRCCRDDEKPPKKRQKRSPSKSQTDEDDLDRAFPQPNLDPQTAPKSAPRPTTKTNVSTATVVIDSDSDSDPSGAVDTPRQNAGGPSRAPVPSRPSRALSVQIFHTIWDASGPPASVTFQVESQKSVGDYLEQIMASFHLPAKQGARFLFSRQPVSNFVYFDTIEDMVRNKKRKSRDSEGPVSIKLEMMTLHDYDLLQESIKAGRQNEAAARRRAEEGPAEVEEVDEELPAPVEEADTRVRLIVRFKDGDRPMSLEKMKFGRDKIVADVIKIFTRNFQLSGKFGLRTDDGSVQSEDKTVAAVLDGFLEDIDEEEERDEVLHEGLVVDLYRRN